MDSARKLATTLIHIFTLNSYTEDGVTELIRERDAQVARAAAEEMRKQLVPAILAEQTRTKAELRGKKQWAIHKDAILLAARIVSNALPLPAAVPLLTARDRDAQVARAAAKKMREKVEELVGRMLQEAGDGEDGPDNVDIGNAIRALPLPAAEAAAKDKGTNG